jgi:hypothetical protein
MTCNANAATVAEVKYHFYKSTTECAGEGALDLCQTAREVYIHQTPPMVPNTTETKCSADGVITWTKPNKVCASKVPTPCKPMLSWSVMVTCANVKPTPRITATFFAPDDTTCSGPASAEGCDDLRDIIVDEVDPSSATKCGDPSTGQFVALGQPGQACESGMIRACAPFEDDGGNAVAYWKTVCTGGSTGDDDDGGSGAVVAAVVIIILVVCACGGFAAFRQHAKTSRARSYAQQSNVNNDEKYDDE